MKKNYQITKVKGGKKYMANKKTLLWLLAILCIGLVTSAWLFSVSGGFNMIVESIPGYTTIDLDIPTLEVNTTEGSDSDSQSTSFLINKDMIMNVTIEEIYQDNSGGECLGGEDDCVLTYHLQLSRDVYSEIHDGDSVSIESYNALRYLNATMECQAYSCPQARSINVDLVEWKG